MQWLHLPKSKAPRTKFIEILLQRAKPKFATNKKTAGFPPEPCGFELANYFRLIFIHDYMIDNTRLAGACVINMHALTRS